MSGQKLWRHSGQFVRRTTQPSKHFLWKMWLHTVRIACSPVWNASKHTAQSVVESPTFPTFSDDNDYRDPSIANPLDPRFLTLQRRHRYQVAVHHFGVDRDSGGVFHIERHDET